VYRVVASDGTVGAERIANTTLDGGQHEARVAAVGDGFVIVWSDIMARADDPSGGIRARLFDASGAPTSAEMFVATERSQREARAQVASTGTRWTVVWHRQMLTVPGSTTVLLRRVDGATPRDSSPMQAVPDGGRAMVIAALAGGNWALAWMHDDGDIHARVVDDAAPALVAGDVFELAADPTLIEGRPAIAAYGAGFIGAWDEDSGRDIAFGTDAATTLPPEAMVLAIALDGGGDPPASVATSPDGVWFAWSGYGFSTPAPALGVFHLPRD
jgi:hypothetical protein